MITDHPITCIWTDVFKIERQKMIERKKKTTRIIEDLVVVLKDNPSSDRIYKTSGIDISKISQCQICAENFGFFKPIKLQCPVCKFIVCKKCQNAANAIELPPPHVGKLLLCKLCKQNFTRAVQIEKFKLSVEESQKSRMILWYNTLMAIKHEITIKMPGFCGVAMSLTGQASGSTPGEIIKDMSLEDIYHLAEIGTTQLKMMELNFKNYENRLKMIIQSFQPAHKKEEILKKNMQLASIHFLEVNLPQFNSLSMALINFLNSQELKTALLNYEKEKEKAKEEEELNKLEEHKRALGLVTQTPSVIQTAPPAPNRNRLSLLPVVPSLTQSLSFSPRNILSAFPFNSK